MGRKVGQAVARAINRLTARQVQTITKPGRHADGDGLYLIVDPGGAKRWALLIAVRGRRRELGLGSVRTLDLAKARQAAREARDAIRRGDDPKAPREPPPTFSEAATAMIAAVSPGWRGRNTKAHWERSLLAYAKDLAFVPIDLIKTDDVVRVVRPYWTSHPETGRKLRQRIEALLDYASVRDWRDGELKNPARLKGHIAKLLPRQPAGVKHRRAIPYTDAPAVMALLADKATGAARAMEWTILTAARETMTTEARRREIFGDVWIVPAHRMKEDDRGDFHIPLSAQALEVLAAASRGDEKPGDLLFPGARGGIMSNMAMDMLLRRLKIDATPHGFRSTFSDWVGDETDHPREIREAALHHIVGDDAERAYRRGDALKKRRRLMQDWADYLRPRRPGAEPAPPDE